MKNPSLRKSLGLRGIPPLVGPAVDNRQPIARSEHSSATQSSVRSSNVWFLDNWVKFGRIDSSISFKLSLIQISSHSTPPVNVQIAGSGNLRQMWLILLVCYQKNEVERSSQISLSCFIAQVLNPC